MEIDRKGPPFPPASTGDILSYARDDVAAGYDAFKVDDPDPGDEAPSGYRWGWQSAKREWMREDDGYDALREAMFAPR